MAEDFLLRMSIRRTSKHVTREEIRTQGGRAVYAYKNLLRAPEVPEPEPAC